jgi:hypothetical protein
MLLTTVRLVVLSCVDFVFAMMGSRIEMCVIVIG